MRRFRFPVLLTLALVLLLSACGGKQGPEWGNLRLTLEGIQQSDTQWSARMVLTNPTDKVQVIQYTGPYRYTMIVTQNGKEILTRPFDKRTKETPEILNLTKGVSTEYAVAWTYLDQDGNRVPPGTYEVSVRLEAITVVQKTGQSEPTVIEPKTVGPVRVKVQ
ncbi:hypothetical protein J2Z79_001256 [Symbiobacterium terraclitae]|uniref:Intracellular proteinase inhibitor BsuPI domain-containing protein n=1 Tax=Symbiobacterium terraclitae TaxID=557451 RepID=A0ABS4JQQ5_9FIRM|nr:BsuPI-related putative proteinase inhibitor [Symbiobacterium terraclitae]MBP2017870.1 hypothetical protein [Symbiobacterium terraclitae]